jgi:3-oxoacyl-[acyl-carrier protein] reductase
MSELDFTNRTVLVVGGSSGIGNGIARRFLAKGAEVHVWGTKPRAEDYQGLADSDLADLHYAQLDVTDAAALIAYEPPFASLDVLVLSQGTVIYGRGEFERPGWDRVMALNIDSVMDCATKFKPLLAASGGSLIIISSVSAFQANRGNPAYAASKAAAVGLTRTLGDAWIGDGIRVNGIAPGLVATKLTRATTDNPKRLEAVLAQIPLRRPAEPSEIGSVALFLASPLASYMVGQTLIVDGGLTNG